MYRDLTALAAEMVIFLDQTMECQGTGDERKRGGSYRMANMTLAKKTVSVCSGFATGDLPRSADKHLGNGLFSVLAVNLEWQKMGSVARLAGPEHTELGGQRQSAISE